MDLKKPPLWSKAGGLFILQSFISQETLLFLDKNKPELPV